MRIKCCAGCAEKLNRFYWLEELAEEPRAGQCPLCFGYSALALYDGEKIKTRYAHRTGGGEREKARG